MGRFPWLSNIGFLSDQSPNRIQAMIFYFTSFRLKFLALPRIEHTPVYARDKINSYADHQKPLLSVVKHWKLAWFGHVTGHDTLSQVILQRTVEGGRRRGRQGKSFSDSIKEWTRCSIPTLVRFAEDRLVAGSDTDAYIMTPLQPTPGLQNEMR